MKLLALSLRRSCRVASASQCAKTRWRIASARECARGFLKCAARWKCSHRIFAAKCARQAALGHKDCSGGSLTGAKGGAYHFEVAAFLTPAASVSQWPPSGQPPCIKPIRESARNLFRQNRDSYPGGTQPCFLTTTTLHRRQPPFLHLILNL